MEEDEDQPADVRSATPVEEEIKRAGNDEPSTQPAVAYESKPSSGPKLPRRAPRKLDKPAKIKEDHCGKKLNRKMRDAKGPGTVKVLVNEKACILPKINPIPRHCLSKKEWLDVLATPSRRCPPPCRKKEVERKWRSVSLRINELALPTRQRMMTTLQDKGDILPAELVDRLITILEGETCLTPEQAEQLFRDNPPIVKKPRKVRKRQCKSSAPSPKKSEVSRSSYNKDAVTCQYLMAEAFVKSLLQWKCTLPKEEFKDIADIVIKRLSTILEYTPVDSGDRTTQQMRFLADIIAAWIAGVLFEVAEAHKEDLEKECEERRKIKEEEETEDDTEESEEEEFIPRIIEESHSLKTVEAAELGEESEKEEEKSDGEEGEDENKIPKDGYDDDDEGDDGPGGAGGVSGRTEPPENDAEPPVDDEKPPEEETDVSPSEELPEESEPAPDEAPLDTLESSSKISATDLDQEPPEGDGPSAPLGEELPADENPLTTEDQEDGDEDQSVVPTAVPSSPPLGTSEDIPDKSAASIPAIESAIEKEVGGEESETGALPETLEEAPVLTPEITSEDAGYTPAAAEVPEEALATPATPQATPSEQVTDSRPSDALATPQSTPSEQLMEEKSSSTLVPQSSTVEGIESEVKSLIDQTPATPIEEPGEKPGEVATKDDASVKNLGLDITAEDLSKAGIPSSLPSPGPQTKGQEKKLKDSEFIEGNIRKMMQTDVPFLDLIRIFDRIENAVAKEKENDGEDLLTDRIHRAVYEKLERLAKAESPEKWTPHLQDVLDVLSGKIAQWVRNILTNSEIFFLNENPPMVESAELRNFGKWIGEMSERANSWTVWMQNMIDEWTKMQSNQVTKIDWQNWTRNFAAGALKWRRYYLESVHHAHHNRTMLAGRDVVKTGEMKYPEWSIQEREIENIDLLQE